jgi:hypothetical protein
MKLEIKIMKVNKVLIAVIIVSLVILVVWGRKYEKKTGMKNFKLFNESSIYGTIEYVGVQHHGAAFKVYNNPRVFIFYPYTNSELNSNHIFDNFSKRGDTVIKAAYSDTLFLYKEGEVYRYTFEKFNKK